MKNQKFFFAKRWASFTFAFKGLRILFKEEHNSWIHLFLATSVVIAGIALNISILEWIVLVFAIGFVFVSEVFNSAIENLCDFISPDKNELIGRIKDLSAAAVLMSAITSFVIGTLIFLPKIVALF